MKKIMIYIVILVLVFAPSMALASPGLLDQYGGHKCLENCQLYGLSQDEYHYHDFPSSPSYLAVELSNLKESYIFFQPNLESYELTATGSSLLINNVGLNTLVRGLGNDQYYCKEYLVFGGGFYDNMNRARIKPVCAAKEDVVLADIKISPKSYYKEVSTSANNVIKKVYHFEIRTDKKKVFTDYIPIEELKGLIVKAETENSLYYINQYDDPMSLRPISPERASFYLGPDYQSKIINFSDSLIYSYKIGQPIY